MLSLLVLSLLAAILIGWLLIDGLEEAGGAPRPLAAVRVLEGKRVVFRGGAEHLRRLSSSTLEKRLASVPGVRRVRRGRSVLTLEVDRRRLVRAVRSRARAGGGSLRVPERSIGSETALPIVRQALRNNCESAALSMLLVGGGVHASQLKLQYALPRSGPADPGRNASGQLVWGDPDAGFVGRADGGGSAGGYGVYPGPIRALARRRGVLLHDLTGSSPSRVYRRLAGGHPVMTWVGLTPGPFETWRSPAGATIRGNFGEHTVVLTGLVGGAINVNDPLDGRRKTWSRQKFETLWKRLDDRALSL